jgi:hypothetical protein
MFSHGIPPVIVAGMLGHSISILLTTYAHFIPTMQDQAAQLMDDILTPIPIELHTDRSAEADIYCTILPIKQKPINES